MVRMVCWNLAKRHDPWRVLRAMEQIDVALLQETRPPPADVDISLHDIDPEEWPRGRYGRTAVVRLDCRVEVEFFEKQSYATSDRLCIAAARVIPPHGEPFIVVSLGPDSEKPHPSVVGRTMEAGNHDNVLHRTISDLSAFIGTPSKHRVVVAGDLSMVRGPSDYHKPYWARRYQVVFDRMEALGLPCIGPQAPEGGRQANPWPAWLPAGSRNVPTYYRIGTSPAEAEAGLDYVFASQSMVDSIRVRALNEPDEWGPSDHCRVLIEVE